MLPGLEKKPTRLILTIVVARLQDGQCFDYQSTSCTMLIVQRDKELRFDVYDSSDYYKLKVSVFTDDKRKTYLVGETWIDLVQVIRPGGDRNDAWHNLNYKGKYAGEIRIEMSYYDSRPRTQGSLPSPAQAGASKQATIQRRPLAEDLSPAPLSAASAFGPRSMGRRPSELAALPDVEGQAEYSDFSRSFNGSASTPYGSVYPGRSSSVVSLLPAIPRGPDATRDQYTGSDSHTSRVSQGREARQTQLAHHQSMPDVRAARASWSSRTLDDRRDSIHESILEEAHADMPELSPQVSSRSTGRAGSGRTLPYPLTTTPAPVTSDYNFRQSIRSAAGSVSPSPLHAASGTISPRSTTSTPGAQARRALPATPGSQPHTLRHAHSSNFASSLPYQSPSPRLTQPPMTRHSISDPYASPGPTRSHPLSQQIHRANSPQPIYESEGDYQDEPLRFRTAQDTPLHRPLAVSPRVSTSPYSVGQQSIGNVEPRNPARQPQTTTPRTAPLRKSVGSGSGSAFFSPDSFDVHNPASRSSPIEPSTNPHKPFQVTSPPLGSHRRSEEPIRGWDGRDIDPSDHLPVDCWAPEPEQKVASKGYGSGERGFGPRETTDTPKRSSLLVNVRTKHGSTSSAGPVSMSGSNSWTSKNVQGSLQQQYSPQSRSALAEIQPRSPQAPSGFSNRYQSEQATYDQDFDNSSALAMPMPYDNSPVKSSPSSYDSRGYGTSALEREMSQIDIGGSRRGRVTGHASPRNGGHASPQTYSHGAQYR